jgi:hypothetical protein
MAQPQPAAQPYSTAPRLVKLFNVIDSPIQLEAADLRIGLVKPGQFITIPEVHLGHQSIVQCMSHGWLVQEGHPSIAQAQARRSGGTVSFPGSNAEWAQPVGPAAWALRGGDVTGHVPMQPGHQPGYPGGPAMPGMPQAGYPGGPAMPGMPTGFALPGMVQRSGNPEVMDSPVGVADAGAIITDGRSRPDAATLVPDADTVFRNSMRGVNTIVPPQPGMVAPPPYMVVPTAPVDMGPPLAGGIIAAQRPGGPQYNVTVGPQGGYYPAQPGAHTQPYGAPVTPSPVTPWTQPPGPVPPPNAGPYSPQGGYVVHGNMGPQTGFPGAHQPPQRGAYPQRPWVQAPPPQPSPLAPGGTMGQLIVPGPSFGQAGLMDVGNAVTNWGKGGDLFETTESVLHDVQHGNRMAGLIANYKEWPIQKRWHFIQTTQDLSLLYKFYSMEVGAPEDRRSNDLIMLLQQRIAMGGGQVPDLNQVRAMSIPQQMPQESNVMMQVLANFPSWSDDQKVGFIGTLKDPEFLTALLQRYRNSPVVDQQLQTRIASLTELSRQAAVQRAAGQPSAVPADQPPFMQTPSGAVVQPAPGAPPFMAGQPVAAVVVDKVLQPPAPPVAVAPIAPVPVPLQPQPAQVVGAGGVIFTPAQPQTPGQG